MADRVTATFRSEVDLQQAVRALTARGIDRSDIHVITGADVGVNPDVPEDNRIEDASHLGAVAAGGLLGLGMAIGSGTAAGVAAPMANNTAVGFPTGGIVPGAVAGAILGGAYGELHDLSLPGDETQLYHQRLEEGCSVVSIAADALPASDVVALLRQHNATDLREH